MKKIVYALVLAILLPLFSANAEKLSATAQRNSNPLKNVKITKEMLLSPKSDFKSNKNTNDLQANEYYTIKLADTPAGWWIGYGITTSPMAYDPISNLLIYSTYNTGQIGSGANAPLYCTINLFWTSDMGGNWGLDTLGAFEEEILVSPSIGVTNTTNATAITDLNVVNYSRYAAKSTEGYTFAGAYYQVRTSTDYQPWGTLSPEEGENYGFYNWNSGDLSVYKSNNESSATTVCTLFPNPAEKYAQYGTYGQASINIDSYDNKFSIPNEWALSNFKLSEKFDVTYNSRMMVDADNSGNVYSCIFNYNTHNDNDTIRTPGVSKSTDGGNTWSSLNLCPLKVLQDYVTSIGCLYRIPNHPDVSPQMVGRLLNYHQQSEYTRNAFIATGNDQYSFITAMYCLYIRNDSLLGKTKMIEISYKDNLWSVNSIADLPINDPAWEAFEKTDASGAKMYDTVDVNQDGYEVLAAKTADGNDIVCTWVANTKIFKFVPPVVTTLGNIDSLYTTDIFGAVRPISSNSWTAVQFTNDNYYNKMTRMPKLVPNRNSIPMIEHTSTFATTNTTWLAYPAQFRNMNYRTFQAAHFMEFNFGNPSKYWPNNAVEEKINNFTLNAPVPNPSNGLTELTFTMNEGAYTSLAVFNAMGVKVADLQNGYTSEGVHGLYINTESYVSGAYYIVLTAGSNSTTTLLNVVH